MDSPLLLPVDDKDLDDDALWAQVDSAAANAAFHSTTTTKISSTTRPLKLPTLRHSHLRSPHQFSSPSPPPRPTRVTKTTRHENNVTNGVGVPRDISTVDENSDYIRPAKMSRPCVSEVVEAGPLAVVKQVQRSPMTPHTSPDPAVKEMSPFSGNSPYVDHDQCEDKENSRLSLSGKFTSVALFKEYQNAAMSILEKSDYTLISGNPFIKKSGWRKIACYFNVSFEIKDKTIEYDETRNVLHAEFVVRAHMQGGRFSDGWGSCDRREKRFNKPNHDVPSTAETRAKNKACQDLLGIGEYRPGRNHSHAPR